jgi:hypothetical protein
MRSSHFILWVALLLGVFHLGFGFGGMKDETKLVQQLQSINNQT